MKKTLSRQVVALLSAGATLTIATLVSASSSTQVAQLAPLVVPRTAHAATVLTDGRVLITGGRDSAGNIVAVSEIFDPATGTSTASATLTTARVDHTATLLPDGRVLVAGGTSVSGSLASTEIFDPSNPAAGFQVLSATMRAARARHTATLLNDGKVLIAGGDDAGTAEIFDPTTETFSSVLLAMAAPRIGHTATLFSDDSVLLAGGNTDSMELFTPADQKFTLDPQKMSAIRTGHEAIELSDTRLLFFEGDTGNTIDEFNHSTDTLTLKDTLDGSASSATLLANGKILVLRADKAGLYAPDAADPSLAFTAFDETSVPGSSILPRSGQTATQLSGDKKILVAGGVNTQNQSVVPALFNPARIWTDKDDYQPGDPVVLSGSGWKANENVYLYAVDSQTEAWTYGSTVAADANGGFVVNPYFIVQLVQNGVDFSVTAVGAQSAMQADVKFTDNVNFQSVTVGGQTGTATFGTAASPTYQVTATYSGSGTIIGDPVTLSFVGTPPTGVTPSFSTTSVTNGSPNSTLTLTTSATTPAGTYTFTVQGKNVPGTTRTATGTLVVGKVSATVTLGSLSQTYDGTPKSATATTTPPGLTVTFTYNGSSTPPINVGSYTVVGTINDTNYSGSATGTLVINKANATVVVTPYTVTYDGSSHTATITSITGVNGQTGATVGTVNVSNTTHTNAGTYNTDSWSFTGTANYNNIAATTITDTINKATPTFSSLTASQTITVGTATITLNGKLNAGSGLLPTGETATITVTGAPVATSSGFNGTQGNFNASVDTHLIAAGSYTITYSYAGDSNFNSATNASTTLTVTGAATTLSVNAASGTYGGTVNLSATLTLTSGGSGVSGKTISFTLNGNSVGTSTTNGSGVATLNAVSLSGINAGTYPTGVAASFAGDSANLASSGTASLTVGKANADIVVTPYNLTYTGTPHTATGSATGVESPTPADLTSLLHLGGTTHTDAGDYPTDAWTFDGNSNYNATSGSVHDIIGKANADITVTPYSVTYDGVSHMATGSAKGVQGETLTGLDLSGTTHTNVGNYTDTWTFTDSTGNYNNASSTVTDKIAKANATITVTPYDVTYDGNAHTATGSAKGINNVALSGLDLSGTTHTNAGTYTDTWTFTDSTGNYNDASSTVTDKIAKANATITVTPYHVTYNGVAHTATGTAKGVLDEVLSGLDLSGTTHTNAGNYTDTWTFTDSTGNYNDASSTVNDIIDKATATIVVTPYHVTYNGAAHTATGTANGVLNEDLTGLDLSGTTHTNAGDYPIDSWTFTNTNYKDASGTVHDIIEKANASIVVNGYTGIYDGFAHGASGSATGVESPTPANLSGLLSLGATFTNVPGGTAFWSFAGNINYKSASGSVAIVIAKANPSITITPYSVTYNGLAHTATGTATGVLGESLAGLDLTGTTHTNAGDYPADPWTFTDVTGNYNNASATVHDSIGQATLTITADNKTKQYSDPVTFTVIYAGFVNGETASVLGGTLVFSPTSAAAQFLAPGTYTITPSGLTSSNYAITFKTGTLTETQEDARATYTGFMFVSTSSPTSSNATVTLSATIQDITAVPADPAYDPYPGDIRNAKVTFINRDNNTVIVSDLPVGLVSPGDTKTGTATYNWSINIGTADSQQYTIGIIVTNYYTRNASTDDTVVTVSKPIPGSITGGGYLVMQSSAGLYPGGLGTKNNFGFNVQNTKTGVKGNINTIIRNNGRTYQIKGNAMTSLSVDTNITTSHPYPTATFNGKSNIQDITNPLAPISIDGNATLQVQMTDAGEPGSNDTIAITVWNKNGGVWFASNWNGTKTIEQKLGGGNLQVH